VSRRYGGYIVVATIELMSRKPLSSSLSTGLSYFTLMKLSHPEYFTTKNHLPSWLADIITHHITIHLRKACVDLGTSIAYLNHLLTARFVGFVYCEVFVAETLSEMRCLSDSVAGATESLAETRANEWEQYITRVSA
jgi:hypothetical protein